MHCKNYFLNENVEFLPLCKMQFKALGSSRDSPIFSWVKVARFSLLKFYDTNWWNGNGFLMGKSSQTSRITDFGTKSETHTFWYFDDIFPMKCHHPKFKNKLTFTGNASCFRDLFNCTLWLWKMVILLQNFFTLWIEITNSGVRNKMVIAVTVALNVYLGGPKVASFIAINEGLLN